MSIPSEPAVVQGIPEQRFDADSPRCGIGTTFWVSFMIAAVVSGFTGAWCAFLGRWAYQATKQSKAVSIAILAVIAAAVASTLILLVGRSM